ncbi:MAG: ABC transporter ATP-binding protein [Patescibacteria group bacterium]|jgi:ABC-2 type transport system ATP-binding protein
MNKVILEINNLSKTYGQVQAVRDISFSIKEGEIVGLLGPNGAGKTTTINMIMGLVTPIDGKIKIFGLDAAKHRSHINESTNFSAVYSSLPDNLTVYQNLYVFGKLYGITDLPDRIKNLLREFDLEKFAKTKAGLLSSGEKSRLNFAKAIINTPKLLFFDEPTSSLDPHIAGIIRKLILAYVKKNKAAVLWTSHNMREIEETCDRILFLSHGQILWGGNPKTLPAEKGNKDLEELFISVAEEPLNGE